MTIAEAAFPPLAESVAGARRFVAAASPDLPEDIVAELALVVSELATNCVLHAGTDFRVSLSRPDREPRDVMLEVSDSAGGRVGVQNPAATETRGRGLQLVARVARDWGVTYRPDGTGKTVWCAFPVPVESISDSATVGRTSRSGS